MTIYNNQLDFSSKKKYNSEVSVLKGKKGHLWISTKFHTFLFSFKTETNDKQPTYINKEIQFCLSNIRAVCNWWEGVKAADMAGVRPLVVSQGHCCCNIRSSCTVCSCVEAVSKKWRDFWRICHQQTQRHIVQVWLMLFRFWFFFFPLPWVPCWWHISTKVAVPVPT